MSLIKLAVFDIAGTTIKDNHEVRKALLQMPGEESPVIKPQFISNNHTLINT
ncbi:hypothetical protein [Pedobacter lusitanus]|uniref:hypothetical protein n=1 Tax=Pedobacter lusitanus TaxID=1503925 RepID=UPI000AD97D45|nr:hypothetical protein [Pedobacter lusitanus]